MKAFEFRLQKVLDYREAIEGQAKDAYLDARAQRLEAEAMIYNIEGRRKDLLKEPCFTVDAHQAIEAMMIRLDDEVRAQNAVIGLLRAEEEKALQVWHQAKQEHEVLVKLREKAHDEWEYEMGLEEQKNLDEWSVLRRSA